MKIAIGCDDAGEPLLRIVESLLKEYNDIYVSDLSVPPP